MKPYALTKRLPRRVEVTHTGLFMPLKASLALLRRGERAGFVRGFQAATDAFGDGLGYAWTPDDIEAYYERTRNSGGSNG